MKTLEQGTEGHEADGCKTKDIRIRNRTNRKEQKITRAQEQETE